jgi:hypothetical protein
VKGGFESFTHEKLSQIKGGRKMSRLKNENLNKCFSLLREYLNEGPSNNKKGAAILALDQLQKITAGIDANGFPVDSNPLGYSLLSCNGKPRVDGSPI